VAQHAASEAGVDFGAIRSLLQPERRPARQPERQDGRLRNVVHLADWVAQQAEGNRNDGLFWAASRAIEAQDNAALDAIARAAQAAGLSEREVSRTIRSAQQQRPFEREAGS
jgi:hypothetical protein